MGAKYNGFFCPYVSHSFNMPMKGIALIYLLLIYVFLSTTCSRQVFLDKNSVDTYKKDSRIHCISNIPSRFGVQPMNYLKKNLSVGIISGVVGINGGEFMMGTDNRRASDNEYPKHTVSLMHLDGCKGSYQRTISAFVTATNYVTTS
jgi:hypothetical protein